MIETICHNVINNKVAIPADIVKIDANDSTEKIKPQYLSNEHLGKLPIIFLMK